MKSEPKAIEVTVGYEVKPILPPSPEFEAAKAAAEKFAPELIRPMTPQEKKLVERIVQMPYRLELNLYGRWVIVNARDPQLAWSGSCWTEHEQGVATGRAQVCNFMLEEEAREYAVGVWGK